VLILIVAWVAIGVVTAVVTGRRGHRPYSWALLGAVLGPLVAPVIISATRRDRDAPTTVTRSASWGASRSSSRSRFNLLVGVDGSDDATGALVTAIALFAGTLVS
jgi:hypothetical protein